MGLDLSFFTPHLIICGLIGLFIISIFAIFVTYDITKKAILKFYSQEHHEISQQRVSTSIDLPIFIYLNIFLIFIYTIILLLRYIFPFHNNHCKSISTISIILFQLTRTLMFTIFIRRLQIIFSDTLFNSHKKYTFILYISTAIYFIPFICYFDWSYKFIGFRLIHYEQNEKFGCVIVYTSKIAVTAALLLDITITSSCLYLFISPLYKLVLHQDTQSIKNQLFNIIIKISILYGTAILSSLIFTILKLLFPFGFYYGIIDAVINGILLILLHPIHNTCYKNICCVLHKSCIKCVNTFHHVETNEQNTSKDPKFNLTHISVLENITSNNISNISGHQTPINILLKQSISNVYKKAAQSQPAFSNKAKSIDELLTQSIQTMKVKMKKSKTEENSISAKKRESAKSIDAIDTFEVQRKQSLKYIVNIRDTPKQNVEMVFNEIDRNNDMSPSFEIGTLSSAKTDMQIKSIKSNTLQFINYESTHL